MVGIGHNESGILPRNSRPPEDRLGWNPPDGHRLDMAPPAILRTTGEQHVGHFLSSHSDGIPFRATKEVALKGVPSQEHEEYF